MRFPFRRPSPSMAVSLMALIVAMGGTSYAAVSLSANSVGNLQLKANAVTGSKVKTGSLQATDFAAGQLPRRTTIVIRKARYTIGENAVASFAKFCNAGERATGGGAYYPDTASIAGDAITESVPTSGADTTGGGDEGETPTGWAVTMRNGGQSVPVEVYAVCAAS